jgi:threonine/homoserine/homoserine lactone efflux protein
MAFESYLLFTTIWFVAAATPGADTMLLLTSSMNRGFKSAIPLAIGITTAKVLLLVISYFSLTALLQASPEAFQVLKFAGAAFLLWRAYKVFNSKPGSTADGKSSFISSFAFAFTIAVSNPQALLFYIAVVPQVAASTNLYILSLIIVVGFSAISAFYIALAAPIRAWMSRGTNQMLLNRIVAVVFVILAGVVVLR